MICRLPLILASSSPRRIQILNDAGFENVKVMPADVEEGDFPLENARRKAFAIADLNPGDIVIGADTVVRFGDQVIGKPRTIDHAKEILAMLSGHRHTVSTAVCIVQKRKDIVVRFEEATDIVFRQLTAADIDFYLDKVYVLDKAGAYAIQEHGDVLIQKIEGSFSNVIGLPIEKLKESLSYLSRFL